MNARSRFGYAAVLVAVTALLAGAGRPRGDHAVHRVTERYPNGRMRRAEEYRDGKLDGTVRGWYADGAPMLVYHYRAGVSEGTQRQWYPSGQTFASFHHHEGHELGQQQLWNADGTIRSNYVIRDGRRYGLLGAIGCTGRGKPAAGAVTNE